MIVDDKEYLEYLVRMGESRTLEFKASLRVNDGGKTDSDITKKIIQTITSFANTDGGKLLIGYHERNQEFIGIEQDRFLINSEPDLDSWTRHLTQASENHSNLGKTLMNLITLEFIKYKENCTCALLTILGSENLVGFLENRNDIEKFYARSIKENFLLKNEEEKKQHIKTKNQSLSRGWSINEPFSYLNKGIYEGNWKGNHVVTPSNLDRLPHKKGLYLFHANVARTKENYFFGSLKTVIYVGSSTVQKSIKNRAKSHFQGANRPFFEECQRIFAEGFKISFLEMENEDDKKILSYEGQIIDYFSPPLNKKRESKAEPRQLIGELGG